MALTLAMACAGSDTTVNQLHPDIAIAPGELDFGGVVVLYTDLQLLQVVNAGRAPLVISDLSLDDDDGGVFSVLPSSAEIAVDDALAIQVDFSPVTYVPYSHNLVVTSNDPDTPVLTIPITGEGIDGPTPDIGIDLLSLDFGQVTVGQSRSEYFTITNHGDGALSIISASQTGSDAFHLVADPTGQLLAEKGGYMAVLVDYEPTVEGGDNATLTIRSDDPDEPEVSVLLLGNGGGAFEYPQAVIDCPDKVDPPVTVDLDGTGSTDPNGFEPLTWRWKLVDSPSGSTTEIQDTNASYTSVYADLAGDYEVQLVVKNSVGVESEPAVCEFKGKPDSSLHIELVWNTGDSDVDLHLIQDGYDLLERPGDCCWCNPNPSWGTTGSSDDPELALDNRVGYGPENIRVKTPTDGRYFVKVHYFEDGGGGTATATVRFWIDGELQEEVSENLTNNRVWDVGYVDWPEGAITMQANDLWKPSSKRCD